jgi:ribulose-phosphate 3-epimerase
MIDFPSCGNIDMTRMTNGPRILPALLECDYTRMGQVIAELEAAGAEAFHLDVMDGHFVPNLTYGPPLIRGLRQATRKLFDVHLMIANPEACLEQYVDAGGGCLTIHLEAVPRPRPLLERIRRRSVRAGLALNPPTPVAAVADYLDAVDLVNVMGVMPGFGGQSFHYDVLDKVRWLRENGPPALIIEIDGGMNEATVPDAVAAGADWLVAGSVIFRASNPPQQFRQLQRLAHESLPRRLLPDG